MLLDVLIVGAGPTGLAAAIELQRLGKRVRIIDKATTSSQHVRAVGVNPQTLLLLEAARLSEHFLAHGVPVQQLFLRSGIRPINAFNFSCLKCPYSFMLSLPQNKIEHIFITTLEEQNIRIERETELVAIAQTPNAITATLHHQGHLEQLTCAYLLAADGAHSSIRTQLGIDFESFAENQRWGLIDAEMTWSFPQGNIFMSPQTLLIVLPLGKNRYCAVSNCENVQAALPKATKINRIYWESTFDVGSYLASTYQKGRIFLAGDAAHIFPPAGGRGMNLGIEDGIMFARHLVENRLADYARIRRKLALQVIRDSNTLVALSVLRHPLSRLARDYILAPIVQMKWVQQRFCQRLTGIQDNLLAQVLMQVVRVILGLFSRTWRYFEKLTARG